MSNFLFNCCNNSQTANYSQATISSISRNINNKPRKSNNINLPKSSLKTLASIRSLKSFQNGSKSTLTYTPPPTQHIPDAITRDLYSAPNQGLNNLLCTPQRSQILINPGVREVTPSTFSTNNKIKFSYSAEKRCDNEESILSSKNQNLMRLNDKNFRSSKHSKKQQQVEREETISETIKKSTDMKKSQISGHGKPQKIKLGGSKFTIMSEQQVQQMPINETSMRLDESEIIINVFHATESQLQKWSAADRKNQQLQSTK